MTPPSSHPPARPSGRSPGRPRDPAKAAAILDAAWSLFLRHGVQATPIERIAALAGVSKVTLYSHFPDKSALFEAAIGREMARFEAAQFLDRDGPIELRLRVFGTGLMTFLASPPAIDFYAAIAGELRRHPGLARAFYDLGPGRSHANLVALIRSGIASGDLAVSDPPAAAEELFGLWQGFGYFRAAFDLDVADLRAGIPRRVAQGVTLFMRLYGAA